METKFLPRVPSDTWISLISLALIFILLKLELYSKSTKYVCYNHYSTVPEPCSPMEEANAGAILPALAIFSKDCPDFYGGI